MNDVDSVHWWSKYEYAILPQYFNFLLNESQARMIREYNSDLIPGLLQTQRYAKSLHEHLFLKRTTAHIDQRVDLRMERQWHLFEQPEPPTIEFLLDEAVLRRSIGNKEILREQLVHLRSMAGESFITVRIVPFSATLCSLVANFRLVLSEDDQWTCCTENAITVHQEHQDSLTIEAFQNLWLGASENALSAAESIAFIGILINELSETETRIDLSKEKDALLSP